MADVELPAGLEQCIRPASDADRAAANEVSREAYAAFQRRFGKPDLPQSEDAAGELDTPITFVVESNEQIVGILALIERRDYMLLENIAIHPGYRGHGIGRGLLTFAEAETRRRGFQEIRLYTSILMPENIRLYANNGYIETHRSMQGAYGWIFMKKAIPSPIEPE